MRQLVCRYILVAEFGAMDGSLRKLVSTVDRGGALHVGIKLTHSP
jgi:hypothetical protein